MVRAEGHRGHRQTPRAIHPAAGCNASCWPSAKKKGGGKGVALFTSLSLGYAVADPIVVPPLVFGRQAVKKECKRYECGRYIAQFQQKRGTGDAVVRDLFRRFFRTGG